MKTILYNFSKFALYFLSKFVSYLFDLNTGNCTGVSIIDSMPLKACHIKREYSNKVFKGLVKKGKTSVGWFFGFKIHFIINQHGRDNQFIYNSWKCC